MIMGILWGVKYRHISAEQTQEVVGQELGGREVSHFPGFDIWPSGCDLVHCLRGLRGQTGTAEHKSPPSPEDDALWSLMHPDNLWLLYCLAISLVLCTCLCMLINIYCDNFNWLALHNHSNPLAKNQVRLKSTAWCEANNIEFTE